MKLSKISIYRYSIVIAIFALMFSLFGKLAFAESSITAGDDFPLTNPNIYNEGIGVTSGASVWRNDSYKYNSYYSTTQNNPMFYIKRTSTNNPLSSYGYILCCKSNETVNENYCWTRIDQNDYNDFRSTTRNLNVYGDYFKIAEVGVSGTGDLLSTNIPIFNIEDVTGINEYVANGDLDGAINKEDVLPQPELSNEIPSVKKITITKQSTQQQQNIFINDVVFTVTSQDLSNIQGSIEGDYFVDLNLLRHRNIAGVTQDTILNEGNEHTSNWVVSGTKTYNDNNTYTVTIPASTLNSFVSQIYEDNGLVSGISSFFSEIYLNQLTISARNEYVQGSEFVVGSWSESYNFTYNYVTKSASAYESPQPNDTDGATDVPAVTPNDEQQNGYNNGDSNISIDAQIKNDYPKYDLWQNLNKTLQSSGEVKTSLDNAWGLFGTLSDNGLIAILGTCMPFVPQEIWNLFTLAITSGISFLICGALFRFLRG